MILACPLLCVPLALYGDGRFSLIFDALEKGKLPGYHGPASELISLYIYLKLCPISTCLVLILESNTG